MATFSEMMVEEFNDFLLERNLSVPNFEKVDLDEDIPIYGKDEAYLKEKIEEVLKNISEDLSLADFECYIIETFEEFLNENGIVISNEEKHEALKDGMDPDEIANIYGSDYGDLQNAIESVAKYCDNAKDFDKLFDYRDFNFEERDDIEL